MDERRNPFPAGDIGQLDPAETRVQQDQADTELAAGNHRVDDPAMIPAEHADHLARFDPRCRPAAGQGVRAPVQLAIAELAEFVDQSEVARIPPGGDVGGTCNRSQSPHRQRGGGCENRAAQIEQPSGAKDSHRTQFVG
ncbi:hypothetical protein GCM10009554_74590 [Kribbella koreensis]|uniref:Uncharacterized protein n=1 Tax=Kribbella koreensis TaxID=57909 RepID=A0ABN1RMI2_9ACTN